MGGGWTKSWVRAARGGPSRGRRGVRTAGDRRRLAADGSGEPPPAGRWELPAGGKRRPGARRRSLLPALLAVLFFFPAPRPATAGDGAVRRGNREGNRLYEKGKWEEALASYGEAQEADPQNPALQYNMGNALYRMNELEKAEGYFSQAAAAGDPRLARSARFNLGNTWFRRAEALEAAGNWAERNRSLQRAIDQWRAVLEMDDTDQDAKFNLEYARQKLLEEPPEGSEQPQQGQSSKGEQGRQGKQEQPGEDQQRQAQGGQEGEEDGQSPQQQMKGGEKPPGQEEGSDRQGEGKTAEGQQAQVEAQDEGQRQQAEGKEAATEPREGQAGPAQAERTGKGGEAGAQSPQALKVTPEEAQRILDALWAEEQTEQKRQLAARGRENEGVEKDW